MFKDNWLLMNPIFRIFTSLLLCFLLLNPYINDESYWKDDNFVLVVYIIICIYLLFKTVYQSFFEK